MSPHFFFHIFIVSRWAANERINRDEWNDSMPSQHDAPKRMCKILIVHFINQKYSNCMSKQLLSTHTLNPLSNYKRKPKKKNSKISWAHSMPSWRTHRIEYKDFHFLINSIHIEHSKRLPARQSACLRNNNNNENLMCSLRWRVCVCCDCAAYKLRTHKPHIDPQ